MQILRLGLGGQFDLDMENKARSWSWGHSFIRESGNAASCATLLKTSGTPKHSQLCMCWCNSGFLSSLFLLNCRFLEAKIYAIVTVVLPTTLGERDALRDYIYLLRTQEKISNLQRLTILNFYLTWKNTLHFFLEYCYQKCNFKSQ